MHPGGEGGEGGEYREGRGQGRVVVSGEGRAWGGRAGGGGARGEDREVTVVGARILVVHRHLVPGLERLLRAGGHAGLLSLPGKTVTGRSCPWGWAGKRRAWAGRAGAAGSAGEGAGPRGGRAGEWR